MSLKSLIIFLFVSLTGVLLLGVAGTPAHASEMSTGGRFDLPKKRPKKMGSGTVSAASMPVRFTWQTIRSIGQGTKMSTSAETFSATGSIVPVGVSKWALKVLGKEAPVFVTLGNRGADGVMYIEQQDLLRVLGVVLSPSEISVEAESSGLGVKGESLQLVLSRTPNRYLETVFRSPEEELFLLKASVFLMLPQ